MKTEQIVILVVAFFLGMLLLNMVKNVCGCGVVEGLNPGWDTGLDTDSNYYNAMSRIDNRCPTLQNVSWIDLTYSRNSNISSTQIFIR